MYELSLFTGAGGGVLGTQHLLRWRALGYVEWDAYCQAILKARIQDGVLHDAPIFGTFENLSAADAPNAIAEWLTLLPQDSRASRSVSLERNAVPTTNATCGPQQSNASAWYDRDSRCWKTCQDSLLLDTSEPSSAILPKAGMTADGVCYPQPKWERRISAIDCGLWPTPNVAGGGNPPELLTPKGNHYVRRSGEKAHLSLDQAVHLWPTPKASNAGSRPNANGGKILEEEVRIAEGLRVRGEKLYPTPRSTDGSHGGRVTPQKARNGGNLIEHVAKMNWPTPTSRDHKDGTNVAGVPVNALLGRAVGPTKTTGSLDPGFVEYLMGWPIGWTDLKPLEMDRFRLWLQQHGVCSRMDS